MKTYKCEVIQKCSLVVETGSTVIVDERQFNMARHLLKPIEAEKPLLVEEKKSKKKK